VKSLRSTQRNSRRGDAAEKISNEDTLAGRKEGRPTGIGDRRPPWSCQLPTRAIA